MSGLSLVETLFRSLKSSGFDIENTHLQDVRLIQKLLCLVMIALVWCYKVGDYLDRHVKPIPIKKHGHRAKSVFKYGLEYISDILLNAEKEGFKTVLLKIVM